MNRQAPELAAATLADQAAMAVLACPGVARLVRGPVATYLPGRVVDGIAVRHGTIRVAVAAWYGLPLAEVAAQVRAAVARLAPGWPVDVDIEDVLSRQPAAMARQKGT